MLGKQMNRVSIVHLLPSLVVPLSTSLLKSTMSGAVCPVRLHQRQRPLLLRKRSGHGGVTMLCVCVFHPPNRSIVPRMNQCIRVVTAAHIFCNR